MRVRFLRSIPGFVWITLAVVALYAPTLDDEWHFDDRGQLDWPGVREGAPEHRAAHYRGPVVLWSWVASFRIFGERVEGYHAFNLFVHLACSLLVARIAGQLASRWVPREAGPNAKSRRLAVATLAGLFFAVHPLATESVAYLTQRSTSIAALFTFLAGSLYLGFRRADSLAKRTALLILSCGVYQAALHSKHLALALPPVLLAFEMLDAGRSGPALRRRIVGLLPLVLLALIRVSDFAPAHLARITEPGAASAASGVPTPASRASPTALDYAATQTRMLVRYLAMSLVPIGQNLDRDVRLSRSFFELRVLAAAAILLAVGYAALRARSKQPMIAFGAAVFLLGLLPTSSLVPSPDPFFEHRVYFSLSGAALAFASLASRADPRFGSAALAALALGTALRLRVWDTELSLWSDAAAKSPEKARPHVNLGLALQNLGRDHEARLHYERALALDSTQVLAFNNLGNLHREAGRLDEARRFLESAVRLDPGFPEAIANLANVSVDLGRFEEAAALYDDALALDPTNFATAYNRAKCFERAGDGARAAAAYDSLAHVRPEDALVRNDLGCALLGLGRRDDAERELRRAIEIRPDWAVAHFNLGLLLMGTERSGEARDEFRTAVLLDPALTAAVRELSVAGGPALP